jgi:hypothetical protein
LNKLKKQIFNYVCLFNFSPKNQRFIIQYLRSKDLINGNNMTLQQLCSNQTQIYHLPECYNNNISMFPDWLDRCKDEEAVE